MAISLDCSLEGKTAIISGDQREWTPILALAMANAGANVVVDILKNGTTIYSTKPLFAVSTATITPGTISVTAFASGDRITFNGFDEFH